MGKQEFYKIPKAKREEIWKLLVDIEVAVSRSKGIVQNDMMLTQEDELDTFYFAVNDIIEDLITAKHKVNDTKELYYTEVYDEDGEVIEHFHATSQEGDTK